MSKGKKVVEAQQLAKITVEEYAELKAKVDAIYQWIVGIPPEKEGERGTPGANGRLDAIDAGTMAALYSLDKANLITIPTGDDKSVVEGAQKAVANYMSWTETIRKKLSSSK